MARSRVGFVVSVLVLGACATAAVDDGDEGSGGAGGGSTVDTGSGGDPTSDGPSTGPGPGSGGGATAGQGGDPVGAGGSGQTTGSTGGSMNNCAHDVCTPGASLMLGCGDPCVDNVCSQDSYCCDTEWDDVCVGEADQFCGTMCLGMGGGTVQPGDLVITEIMNNPAAVADPTGEWFEVYNVAAYPLDLQGLVIRHQVNDPNAVHTIAQSVVVQPGAFAVLAYSADPSVNGGVTADYAYGASVSLNNTADMLALEDANAGIIDEVYYDEMSGLDPNGKSRSLDPAFMNDLDNDDDTFFCEAVSAIPGGTDLGTPGAMNDSCP
jgi:lamin tail-like protein